MEVCGHPVLMLQVPSVVHGSPSLQLTGGCVTTPVCVLQLSCVQALLSLILLLGVYTQLLFTQASFVQALLSLHPPAQSLGWLLHANELLEPVTLKCTVYCGPAVPDAFGPE